MFQPDPLASAQPLGRRATGPENAHILRMVCAGQEGSQTGRRQLETRVQRPADLGGFFYAKKQHWEGSCHSSASQSWMKPPLCFSNSIPPRIPDGEAQISSRRQKSENWK